MSAILHNRRGLCRFHKRTLRLFKPPPRGSVSEWADEYRELSPEASSKSGKFRSAAAPYQIEPMNSVKDPTVERTVLKWPSQTGKTEVVNNIVGYFIHMDPCPMLVVQPTIEMGAVWSKDRLATMVRDTRVLRDLVGDAKSRSSNNTIASKSFPGGNIAIAGANSPAGLSSRPRRVAIFDEVDRYPLSAAAEGDPVSLGIKRTETFWNSVLVLTSTPTVKGVSRIENEYEQTDKRNWFVPCPLCGEYQTLEWKNVKWPKGKPEEAYLQCACCGEALNDRQRLEMVLKGEWRPTAEFKGKRGYYLNGIYSPFKAKKGFKNRLHQMAANFLEAKEGGTETMRVWVNTFLAETFEEESTNIDPDIFEGRFEDYNDNPIPEDVLVITGAADVQNDRIEVEIIGWGLNEESWGLGYEILYGDPQNNEVWKNLREILERNYAHPCGIDLKLSCFFIDMGFRPERVLEFCKSQLSVGREVFPCKGTARPGPAQPPLIGPRPSRNNELKIPHYVIGTNAGKELIYDRILLPPGNPRSMHYPRGSDGSISLGYDDEYFKQLTCERVRTRYAYGRPYRVFEIPYKGRRNEALDIRVYATAALRKVRPNFEKIKTNLAKIARKKRNEVVEKAKKQPPRVNRFTGRKSKGWVNGW